MAVGIAHAVIVVAGALPAPQGLGHGILPFDSTKVVTQCVVQLELISTTGILSELFLESLSTENVLVIISALQGAAVFAQNFNADKCVCSSTVVVDSLCDVALYPLSLLLCHAARLFRCLISVSVIHGSSVLDLVCWRCCHRPHREALCAAGFMKSARQSKLPSLLRQDSSATQQLMALLFRLYHNDSAHGASAHAVQQRQLVVVTLTA
jgi:hypothetical protein